MFMYLIVVVKLFSIIELT